MSQKHLIHPGDRFGKLTVESMTDLRNGGRVVWQCRCDCGREIQLDTAALKRGVWHSCGCDKNVKPGMTDLTGKRFGRLTALRPTSYVSKTRGAQWVCRCDCGAEVVTYLSNLIGDKTKSCGCLNSEESKKRLLLVDGTSVRQINNAMTKKYAHNSSGYTGVYYHKQMGKWGARIQFKRRHYSLGLYTNIEDAIKARKVAEQKIFGESLEWYYQRNKNEATEDAK